MPENISTFRRNRRGFAPILVAGAVCLAMAGGCSRFSPMMCHTTARQQRKLDEARDLLQEEKWEKAEGIISDVIRQSPTNIDGRKLLVTMYLEQGRLDEAIAEMHRVLQLDPRETEVLTELAMLLMERQRYAEAESVIDQALTYEPHHPPLLMMQAELRERRGADRDALASYYRVLASNPEDPQANLRIACIEMRRGKHEQAIPILRQIAQNQNISPEIADTAQEHLATAYAERQRWTDACRVLSDLTAGRACPHELLYKLAYAQFRSGQTNEGKKSLEKFLAQAPHDPRGAELANQFAPQLLTGASPTTARVAIIPAGHYRDP